LLKGVDHLVENLTHKVTFCEDGGGGDYVKSIAEAVREFLGFSKEHVHQFVVALFGRCFVEHSLTCVDPNQ